MATYKVKPTKDYIVGELLDDMFREEDDQVYNNKVAPGVVEGNPEPAKPEIDRNVLRRYGTADGIALVPWWNEPNKVPGSNKVLLRKDSIQGFLEQTDAVVIDDEEEQPGE